MPLQAAPPACHLPQEPWPQEEPLVCPIRPWDWAVLILSRLTVFYEPEEQDDEPDEGDETDQQPPTASVVS